ncbi:Uncharacterized protein TCM_030897 [Theobroma cacao]|uniref:Uncharacterized protein n=1 Tax=Theobroma cacao TaxID=3641 RepID=A0A061F668_THECC|nr:Uncharacterized protein TCM_030897 [Theobroma cacao]
MAEYWGDFVGVDKSTYTRERFDRDYMMVRVLSRASIPNKLLIEAEGKLFCILVRIEGTERSCDLECYSKGKEIVQVVQERNQGTIGHDRGHGKERESPIDKMGEKSKSMSCLGILTQGSEKLGVAANFKLKQIQRGLNYVMKWDTKEGCCPVRIRNIIFSTRMNMKYYHLAFVAERSPKLGKQELPEACDITVDRVSRIIQKNWGELEELSLGPLAHDCSDRFFQRISNCKNLTKLHIFASPLSSTASRLHFILDENNASIIAEHLLQLRVLNIDGTKLHKFGVETLLSECKNLAELNLRLCRGVVDPPISFLIITPTMKLLQKIMTVEIKSDRMKNCTKTWFTYSSADRSLYTAEELVNQLWTGDVEEIEMAYSLSIGQEDRHLQEALVRIAAGAIVSISSSAIHACLESTSCEPFKASWNNSLYWFARVASSVVADPGSEYGDNIGIKDHGDHEEFLSDGIDYFEAMTLNLTEITLEES